MLPKSFTPELLSSLELLKLRSRKSFLGSRQGGHISPKKGHGMEFSDYRRYEPGDNPRDIDWSVFGRTERLYVKRFQEEQDLSVLVMIDTTASMVTPADSGKWSTACDIALALSYVTLMEQSKLYIAAPGYLETPGLVGARALHQVAPSLLNLDVTGNNDLYTGISSAVGRIRFPGIAVLISDFLMPFEEIEKIFRVMRAKNLEITAIQVLAPSDVNPMFGEDGARIEDSETGEEIELQMDDDSRADYKYLLEEHNQKLKMLLADGQISYASIVSDQNLTDFLVNTLPRTGLLR